MTVVAKLGRGGWGPTTSHIGEAEVIRHRPHGSPPPVRPTRWSRSQGAIHRSGRQEQTNPACFGATLEKWPDVDATPRRAGAIHVHGQRSQTTVDRSSGTPLSGGSATSAGLLPSKMVRQIGARSPPPERGRTSDPRVLPLSGGGACAAGGGGPGPRSARPRPRPAGGEGPLRPFGPPPPERGRTRVGRPRPRPAGGKGPLRPFGPPPPERGRTSDSRVLPLSGGGACAAGGGGPSRAYDPTPTFTRRPATHGM